MSSVHDIPKTGRSTINDDIKLDVLLATEQNPNSFHQLVPHNVVPYILVPKVFKLKKLHLFRIVLCKNLLHKHD